MFWEPLFWSALWSFPDSCRNKSSHPVSSGSNVVFMLWGLLVMQSSINGDCQEERLKEHPSSIGNIGADGCDRSESLVAKLHWCQHCLAFPEGNYGNLKQCRQPNCFNWFRWHHRFVFFFFFLSCRLTYLWSHKLNLLSHVFIGINIFTQGRTGCM